MSYKINNTIGDLIAEIPDGLLETNSTSITLIGKNSTNFGESINENFVKLLENFASSSPPERPIKGQIWYNTKTGRLNVFDGDNFRTSGNPIVLPQQPNGLIAGDLWVDNLNRQLKFYDGENLLLAGPIYTKNQGVSGFKIITVFDNFNVSHTLAALYVSNTILGFFSADAFILGFDLQGFGPSGTSIQIGFNKSTLTDVKFDVVAKSAENILGEDGTPKPASSLIFSDEDAVFYEDVAIQNETGLFIGAANQLSLRPDTTNNFIIENLTDRNDIVLRVKNSNAIDALTVRGDTLRIGIFNSNPEYTLDLTGDLRITGNLLVEGETTSLDISQLRIEDKTIELATNENGAVLENTVVDGGGIILKATPLDHTILYEYNATDVNESNWNFSEHINIPVGKEYKIDDVKILSSTALHESVTVAEGIVEIKKPLQYLKVDQIDIDDNEITTVHRPFDPTNPTSFGEPLDLILKTYTPPNTPQDQKAVIDVTENRLVHLIDPVDLQDATTKSYVDNLVYTKSIGMTLDITGLDAAPFAQGTSINTRIADILDKIVPFFDENGLPEERTGIARNGTILRLHCTSMVTTNGPVYVDNFNIEKTYRSAVLGDQIGTVVSNLEATLVAGTDLVVLTSGTTANLNEGMQIRIIDGPGAFAISAEIATITDTNQFRVSLNHALSGAVRFDAVPAPVPLLEDVAISPLTPPTSTITMTRVNKRFLMGGDPQRPGKWHWMGDF